VASIQAVVDAGQTHQGAAVLAGQGGLVAPGIRYQRGASTITAQGLLVGAPTRYQGAAVVLSATGLLAGAGQRVAGGAAAVAGAGGLVGAGQVMVGGQAVLAGSGALVGASTVLYSADALLPGTAVVMAAGDVLSFLRSRFLDVVEYILSRLAPQPVGMAAALPDFLADAGMSEPFVYQAGQVYAWEEDQRTDLHDVGREDFAVRLVVVVDSRDEEPMGQRQRAVSQALHDARVAALSDLRTSMGDEPWEYATVADVDPDYLRGFNTRGFSLLVTGYRLV
jgi:hypothetical protein